MRMLDTTNGSCGISFSPSKEVLLGEVTLQGGIECEVRVWIVRLEGEAALLAVNVALDIQFVNSGHTKQKVCGGG